MLSDIELVPFSTVRQTAEALGILASPTSPLRGLLKTVADNTTFVEQAAAAAVAGSLSSAAKTATDRIGDDPEAAQGCGGHSDDARRRRHHRALPADPSAVAGEPAARRSMRSWRRSARSSSSSSRSARRSAAAIALEALTNPRCAISLKSLQEDAATLPPVRRDVVAQIGEQRRDQRVAGGASNDLENQYRQEVLAECNRGRRPAAIRSPTGSQRRAARRLRAPVRARRRVRQLLQDEHGRPRRYRAEPVDVATGRGDLVAEHARSVRGGEPPARHVLPRRHAGAVPCGSTSR